MNGANKRGWFAYFELVPKASNFTKIEEGNYEQRAIPLMRKVHDNRDGFGALLQRIREEEAREAERCRSEGRSTVKPTTSSMGAASMQTDPKLVRDWLVKLGIACRPRPHVDNVAEMVAQVGGFLCLDFPTGAFTDASRREDRRSERALPVLCRIAQATRRMVAG